MPHPTAQLALVGTCLMTCLAVAACGEGSGGSSGAATATQGGATTATAKAPKADAHDHDHADHDHAHGDGHDHSHDDGHAHAHDGMHAHGSDHGHGPTVELGEQASGALTVKASRDGDVTPGGELPVDIWVTGGSARVSSVRFWVGIESGKGSVKAKAALETDNWHNHAEVPSPLPDGSKLWVSIDLSDGTKSLVSFDLKR
jgi:hypothetical protein